jgi:hypothetical protein
MRKVIYSIAILAIVAGCGPKKTADESGAGRDPFDLRVEPGNKKMTLQWKPQGSELMAGYNIYISDSPHGRSSRGTVPPSDVKPFNSVPFPGDTNPDDEVEVFIAEGLENGVRYFVSVRVVFPDGVFSETSAEIPVVCGPRGEIELSIRYKSERDGYSFEDDSYVRADVTGNDLYFYSKDGVDYLASPDRLDGFLKPNRFLLLSCKGSLADVSACVSKQGQVPSDDRVEITEGDWFLIRTPENMNALVRVNGFTGRGEDRRVKLFFTYSTLADGTMFF